MFSLLAKQGAPSQKTPFAAASQSNLLNKHAKLFALDTEMANNSKQHGSAMNTYGLFSPKTLAKESSPIMEENSCSDNLSNLGQGPSPMKQPANVLALNA